MSKIANEKEGEDNISVSKIYETLKSAPFLKKLYWDVLADFKEKPTFKQMKEATDKLLNKKLEVIADLSNSESDNMLRKTIVAEICSMTYAIDTVYSKILYIKLQKEFKSHILDIVKDLRKERKIPDSVWSKLQISDDSQAKAENSIEKNPSQQKPGTSKRPVRKKRQISTVQAVTKNSEIQSEIHEDLKAINSEENKAHLPSKKIKLENEAVSKILTSTPIKNIPKKKPAVKNHTTLKQSAVAQITETDAVKPAVESHTSTKLHPVTKTSEEKKAKKLEELPSKDDIDSDSESVVSLGQASLASVSSVHTSDLSSFDDEISLPSDDEANGKKKLSLNDLKEMWNKGKLSSKVSGKSNGSKFKTSQGNPNVNTPKNAVTSNEVKTQVNTALKNSVTSNEQTKVKTPKNDVTSNEEKTEASPESVSDSADSSTENSSNQSVTLRSLPKRIRKPNSKYYSSENVLNTKGKESRKQLPEATGDRSSEDVMQPSSNRKRTSNETSFDSETKPHPSKVILKDNETSSDSSSFTRSKKFSDLCKPYTPVRSLTSRVTAPLTLFSTSSNA